MSKTIVIGCDHAAYNLKGIVADHLRDRGFTVIDVGTGSGILAIGAAMLGAKDVLAIDIDPTAVKVAQENIEHNHLTDRIVAIEGNLLDKTDSSCDLCVANIIADVICFFAKPMTAHFVPGGKFICSGII